MASNTEQIVKVNEENSPTGHNIHYSFPVRVLAFRKSRPFLLDYNSNCPVMPTSWTLRITYQQSADTGIVSCIVTLTRTDLTNSLVEAYVSISFLDENDRFLQYPRPICSGQILANETILGIFNDSRHPGLRSYIFSLKLVVRISIFIRSCHLPENLDHPKYLFSNVNDKHCSKI